MVFACINVSGEQAEALLPILSPAEEGDERIQAALHDPTCRAYAAMADGALVGAAVVRWKQNEESEILYIAIADEKRGKGYGRRILAALQAELPEHGRTLLVGTANTSMGNLIFYQKCGFRMYEVRRDYFAYVQPPLQEQGIVVRDMLVLRYDLPKQR